MAFQRTRPAALLVFAAIRAVASDPIQLPNGFSLTPSAVPHSVMMALNPGSSARRNFSLGQAVTTPLSPDGTQLLVLTSGYNRENLGKVADFPEFVFVYDVTSYPPRPIQALPVPNSFCGMAWNPNGDEFYVSGGVDDTLYIFNRRGLAYSRAATVHLGHKTGIGLFSNAPGPLISEAPRPMVAGIGVTRSGTVAVVANFYNDSISVVDLKNRKVTGELDLRPGVHDPAKTGVPGGEYPYWIAIRGDERIYVSSPRDREIVAVQLGSALSVANRIKVVGQPNRILLNRAEDRLFVALDNSDAVAVIDTKTERVIGNIPVTAPPGIFSADNQPKGANPNSLALSPDERTLYVTDGGTNAVAVVSLESNGTGQVRGLIPTGWYPNSVSVSADGQTLYVVNGKSVPGPNPGNCRGDAKTPKIPDCSKLSNSYVYTLEKASLWAAPVPATAELDALTRVVAENNHFNTAREAAGNPVIAELHRQIKHIIYVIKENRTYDQVLGDLEVGDGDPALTEFPEPLTPNHHLLARRFVTLDNFLDSGEVSGVGWNWTTAARTTDYTEKTVPPNYAGRGFVYDWEGTNRLVNVGIDALPERVKAQPLLEPSVPPDPNLLPGSADVAAPDAESGEPGAGYIWDEAIRAGLTVRNYGVFCDLGRYENPKSNPSYIPISKAPFADKIPQAIPTKKALIDRTDPYYRSFDQNNADFYLFKEWEREFDQFVGSGDLPNLSLVRLAHDHFGDFGTALYGINTPALQIADNDYALGLLAEKVASSSYKDDTLIFVIEDDAQDGPDHVDAHRSVAFVMGPYVRQGVVVSKKYTTVSMLRTIEDILGVRTSSLFSAAVAPMTEIFDLSRRAWTYRSLVPDILRGSELPLPPASAENSLPRTTGVLAYAQDKHDAAYWQKKLGDMDYDVEDKLDNPRFNRELWKGMMGRRSYPRFRTGQDLRRNREVLLAPYKTQ